MFLTTWLQSLSSHIRHTRVRRRAFRAWQRRRQSRFLPVETLESRSLLSASPVFSPDTYSFSIQEGYYSGTPIGSGVSATDADGDVLWYSIASGDSRFSMSSNQLTINGSFDFECGETSFTVNVDVSDMESTDTATVTVNVTDVAENPTLSPTSYTFSVSELAPYGTVIGQLLATDPQGDPLSFIIDDGVVLSFFEVESTGNVKLISSLNYEATSSYTFDVAVSDMYGNYAAAIATVTVNVLDVDEIPQFADPAAPATEWVFGAISEMVDIYYEVGTVPVSDPQGDFLTITVYEGDIADPTTWIQSNAFFAFDDNGTARIQVRNYLDYESQTEHHLILEARDFDGNADTVAVKVTIANEQEWTSTGIFVVSWRASLFDTGARRHTEILIIPTDQTSYETDPNYVNTVWVMRQRKHYTTVGADRTGTVLNPGNLRSDVNRSTVNEQTWVTEATVGTCVQGGEDHVIAQIFSLDGAYGDNLAYAFFPEVAANAGHFNSNSYISGLINALNQEIPGLGISLDLSATDRDNNGFLDFPGWPTPIPLANFGL